MTTPTSHDPFLRVVVAGPDPRSRGELVGKLAERWDIEVLGEAEDGIAVTELAVKLQPDAALLDVRLPDLMDACRWIRRTAGRVRVVVLGSEGVGGSARSARSDAWSLEEFLAAVTALRDGGSALDPFLARSALARLRRATDADASAYPPLTDRELEVLTLRADGARVRDVAKRLYISENTVKNHFRRILEKLGGLPEA